jgi:release factor glutamine methyltransferase
VSTLHASRSFRSLLREVSARLGSAPQARWLVALAAGWSDTELLSRLDEEVPPGHEDRVVDMIARRLDGEPLQYVLGTWEFRTLEVHVDRRVLVPRPETEQVAGYALEELTRAVNSAAATGTGASVVAADLGTGAGVLALSLAAELPSGPDLTTEIWATDSSRDALEVARLNLARLKMDDPAAARAVCVAEGSWFDALPRRLVGSLALVVSNPPYVAEEEFESLDPSVRDHEPRAALVAGPSGLEALDLLVRGAWRWLRSGGGLVLELAPAQSEEVARVARSTGFTDVEVRPDLAGLPRALVAHRP